MTQQKFKTRQSDSEAKTVCPRGHLSLQAMSSLFSLSITKTGTELSTQQLSIYAKFKSTHPEYPFQPNPSISPVLSVLCHSFLMYPQTVPPVLTYPLS